MLLRFLADLILLLHLAFILFVVAGGVLILYRRWLVWVHVPAILWAAWVNWAGWVCPLTPLEVRLRHAAGEAGYTGGFVEHYIVPLVYPPGLDAPLAGVLAVGVLLWNLILYAVLIYRLKTRT